MKNNIIIPKEISKTVAMAGMYYQENHPGGISAVVQYWSNNIEDLQYFPTCKDGSNFTRLIIFAKSVLSLRKTLRNNKAIKILHIHTAAGADIIRTTIMVDIAKKYGLKVIIHSHSSMLKDYYNSVDDKKKAKIREMFNKADILVVLSESWRNYFRGLGIPDEKIVILHNITAYPTIVPATKNENKVRLLFMGEIGPRKGVFDLLKSIGNHREELKDKIELRIGGNKMEDKLMATIHEYGLESFVHFEGFVANEKKIELLNWANVFVLPSHNEGLPISILEAMSYKMPIISTPVGGIPEVVDESNGVLVTPGDDQQIYEAIIKYVDNQEMIEQQGQSSFKKVETYMPDYVLNHLKQIYEGLLK